MTDIRATALVAMLSLGLIGGCSKGAEPPAAAQAPGAGQPAQTSAPAEPAAAGQAPMVTGPVLETMNASNYTYVRVKTDAGDVWAAGGVFPVAVGDRVTLALEMPMENFHSESLKRDFPLIYFTTRIGREGEVPAAASGMMSAHGMGGGAQAGGAPAGAAAAQVTEPIAPAPGGTDRRQCVGQQEGARGQDCYGPRQGREIQRRDPGPQLDSHPGRHRRRGRRHQRPAHHLGRRREGG